MTTEALTKEVERYMKNGFTIVSQTDNIVQLERRKKFSIVWFVFTFGLYLLYYAFIKGGQLATLILQEDGTVKRTGAKVGKWG